MEVERSENDNALVVFKPNLPPDIIDDILSRLPVKPLLRFRCVSQSWCTLLTTNSAFIQKHLTRTNQDNASHGLVVKEFGKLCVIPSDTVAKELNISYIKASGLLHLVGSSNGLVCFQDDMDSIEDPELYLCNPATGTYIKLPPPSIENEDDNDSIGFGFHPIINDYKVVRLVSFEESKDGIHTFNINVEVYSVRTSSWRKLGAFPYFVQECFPRAVMNGNIHWIGSHGVPQEDPNCDLILCFHMDDEKFHEVPVPDNIKENEFDELEVRTSQGYLWMFVTMINEPMDVWMMKNYGIKESWQHLFRIEVLYTIFVYPVEFFQNGELLLDIKKGDSYELVSWNLTSGELRVLGILGGRSVHTCAVPYVETLIPLKGGTDEIKTQDSNG